MSPEKTVALCVLSFGHGVVSPFQVKNVLKQKDADVSPIVNFLHSEFPHVQLAAIEIIGKQGNLDLLFDLIKEKIPTAALLEVMKYLHQNPKKLDSAVVFLQSENPSVKEKAVEMFRKAGRTDCLGLLLFSNDDFLVKRAKRLIQNDHKS